MFRKYYLSGVFSLLAIAGFDQSEAAKNDIRYSDMNSWVRREIKESGIIGGKNKVLYEIGKSDTIIGEKAREIGDSPWETSSVYAKVAGIVKVSSTVFPEERNGGYCARLETRLEEVVVLGLINLKVLATGTIFTGSIAEPVKDSKDPMQKLMQGMEYNKRPQAIKFDYKAKTGGSRMKATGFSKSKLPGKNAAEVSVILQKRWEDEDGNILAKRIGTGWVRFDESKEDWVNDYTLSIQYGDISSEAGYEDYMGLVGSEDRIICGKNSAGENKKITEIGWGTEDEAPTHIIVRFSAGYGGAYVGSVGDILWVDNIGIVD